MKWLLALAACLELFAPWVASHYVALPCNDQEALAIAEKAVELINANRNRGYKYALDRIENVQKIIGNTRYYLEIEVRETVCHVLNPKSLRDCEIRRFTGTKADGDCEVLIQTTPDGTSHLDGYECDVSPDSRGDVVKQCPDCPALLSPDDDSVKHAAQVSRQKFNNESNHIHRFDIQEIARGYLVFQGRLSSVAVEYILKETTCRKNSDICTLELLLNPQIVFCKSDVSPGITGLEYIHQNCEFLNTQKAAVDGAGAVPEGEDTTNPAADGSVAPPVETDESVTHGDVIYDDTTPQTDTEMATLQNVRLPIDLPKRKRSAEAESSDSSEEFIPKVTVVFPKLPADPATCPGSHKYSKYG